MKLTKSIIESLKGFLSAHIPMVRKGDIYGIYNRWACATDTDLDNQNDVELALHYIQVYKDNLDDE